MRLSQQPILRVEDFPGQQNWLGRLFVQLNPFIQTLFQIFDANISFGDNIKAVTKTYSISTFQSFSFLWPYKDAAPQDVRVIQATKGNSRTPSMLMAAWSYDSGTFSITIHDIVEVSSSGVASLSGIYNFTMRATV